MSDRTPRPGSAEELAQLEEENAQLKKAISARPVIDQARGALMVLGPCSAEEAWQVLVDTSQHTNTRLAVVARAVLAVPEGTEVAEPIASALRDALARVRARRSASG